MKNMIALVVLIAASSQAQMAPVEPLAPMSIGTFGTSASTVYAVSSDGFSAAGSSVTWGSIAFQKYVANNNGCCLTAPLMLPSGALISLIAIEGCDSTVTGSLDIYLAKCSTSTGACTFSSGTTGAANASGCGLYGLPVNVVVDNAANTHFLEVTNSGDVTGAARFRSFRVYYTLQVSQPPAVARFTDVPPSHAFYQYIEALTASGITSGCTASQFCPDAPLTRGQMAVFLARALGLHWTP